MSGTTTSNRLCVLPLGGAMADKKALMVPEVEEGTWVYCPSVAVLVVADGRVVLVDTGMDAVHVEDPEHTFRGQPFARFLRPVMTSEDTLESRLAEVDLALTDVTDVINTHLHFDHAGNNHRLERSTFHVQRAHYESALGSPSCPNEYWNLEHLRYELIDGERELFPGIEVLPTDGHVVGHQSVLVTLGSGRRVLVCGDAIFSRENVDRGSWGSQADPDTARASGTRLWDLATRHEAVIVFGHDPDQERETRYSPYWYE